MTIAFGGDIHFEGAVRRLLDGEDGLGELRASLGSADVAVVNLETAITDRGVPQPKIYHFRASPKALSALDRAGVDVAFPLLHDAVVNFSATLAPDLKLRGTRLRYFFKEALRGFLPDEIIAKKKQGFGLPFGVWATRHPALRAFATDSLHSLAGRGIVRAAFARQLVDELLPQHPGYYGDMVWILMMLEQWLRQQPQPG